MPGLARLLRPSLSRVLSEGASFLIPAVGVRPGLHLIPAPLQAKGLRAGLHLAEESPGFLGKWRRGHRYLSSPKRNRFFPLETEFRAELPAWGLISTFSYV